MRVLAVDDEHFIRDLLARCLKSWGYKATLVEDGTAAWEILKRPDSPRILIIDWDMPGLSGPEVVRLLRGTEHGRDVYVVMLTGRAKKSDLVIALEAGVDDYLTKPFNAREVQLRLARASAAQKERAVTHTEATGIPSATTLGGRYRMDKKIGEGGMAEVWLGEHLALEIPIAIKFMKPIVTRSGRVDYASFEREARAAAKLRSENILHVYDHGVAPGGVPYLIMEHLQGESLDDRIRRLTYLEPAAVVSIMKQLARALDLAHARGVVHGDVKPENVILVEDPAWPHGLAKLVDFGLARPVPPKDAPQLEDLAGTPNYMAPEHLTGAPPSPALDVWALAVTTFVAFTSQYPFDAKSLPALVARICKDPATVVSSLVPGLPPALDAWFDVAFDKKPERRFPTATALASALEKACPSVRPSPQPSSQLSGAKLPTELLGDLSPGNRRA